MASNISESDVRTIAAELSTIDKEVFASLYFEYRKRFPDQTDLAAAARAGAVTRAVHANPKSSNEGFSRALRRSKGRAIPTHGIPRSNHLGQRSSTPWHQSPNAQHGKAHTAPASWREAAVLGAEVRSR